jgi:hypothetical protein
VVFPTRRGAIGFGWEIDEIAKSGTPGRRLDSSECKAKARLVAVDPSDLFRQAAESSGPVRGAPAKGISGSRRADN